MTNIIDYLKNTISFDELKNNLKDAVESVGEGDFKLIVHNNEVKVMMISIKEYEQLKQSANFFYENDVNIVREDSKVFNNEGSTEDIIKIGKLVKIFFNYAEKNKLLTQEYINKLCDLDYSKAQFGISYSLLKPFDSSISKEGQLKGNENDKYSRYWNKVYKFNGNEYFICSQWYERNKERFVNWVKLNLKLDTSKFL